MPQRRYHFEVLKSVTSITSSSSVRGQGDTGLSTALAFRLSSSAKGHLNNVSAFE